MSISVQYKSNAPGVIVEYIASNSLSITSSATAVPAIAGPTIPPPEGGESNPNIPDGAIAVNNWLEVEKLFALLNDAEKTLHAHYYATIRSYFNNGGGRCYLVPVNKITDELPRLDDVTLLVQAGQDFSTVVGLPALLSSLFIFAILDAPNQATPSPNSTVTGSPDAATYYPWLKSTVGDTDSLLPPSAAVAGVYCQNDRLHGPWWTPANVSLQGVAPAYRVSDNTQSTQIKHVNMIRDMYRRNAVVWGGRTLEDTDDWRYISVKRLFNMLQRDIRDAMRRIVFHPNTPLTWQSARSAITSYLNSIWLQGGLAGSSQQTAFFVNVGLGVTMTNADILNGVMIVEVGVAAVRPAEFIVLRFSQIMGE